MGLRSSKSYGVCAVLAALAAMGCGDDGSTARVDAMSAPADARIAPVDANEGETRFTATWNLIGGCLAGDEVELEVESTVDGRTSLKRFPCTAASGTSDHVGTGNFNVQLRVIDNDREMLPDAGPIDLDSGPPPPEAGFLVALSNRMNDVATVEFVDTLVAFAFTTNTATISTSWSFKAGDEVKTCAEAGAVSVELEYSRVGVAIERTIKRPCTDISDESGDLPTGLYYIIAKALDGSDVPVTPNLAPLTMLFVGNQATTASLVFAVP